MNFDRAIEFLQRMIDETTNEDGSLDDMYEDIELSIKCLNVVKSIKELVGLT